MSSNIRVPVMPEPEGKIAYAGGTYESEWISSQNAFSEDQLAALNAEWLEKVGPVVNALSVILNNNESLVFEREARAALSAITKD
jgi:hypothetical protein